MYLKTHKHWTAAIWSPVKYKRRIKYRRTRDECVPHPKAFHRQIKVKQIVLKSCDYRDAITIKDFNLFSQTIPPYRQEILIGPFINLSTHKN